MSASARLSSGAFRKGARIHLGVHEPVDVATRGLLHVPYGQHHAGTSARAGGATLGFVLRMARAGDADVGVGWRLARAGVAGMGVAPCVARAASQRSSRNRFPTNLSAAAS